MKSYSAYTRIITHHLINQKHTWYPHLRLFFFAKWLLLAKHQVLWAVVILRHSQIFFVCGAYNKDLWDGDFDCDVHSGKLR